MKVEDVFTQNRRLWVRLHEKGGKHHELPCHHNLEIYLHEYLDRTGIAGDPKSPLFRTIGRPGRGRGVGRISTTPLPQPNAQRAERTHSRSGLPITIVRNHSDPTMATPNRQSPRR